MSAYWFAVTTAYPDRRGRFHLGVSADGGRTARSICAGRQLDLVTVNRGSPAEPQPWMCRHCLARVTP